MARTVVKRIRTDLCKELEKINSDHNTAIETLLNIKPSSKTSEFMTRMEIEDLIETKIEQAKRGY